MSEQTNSGQANDGTTREEWTDEPTGDGGPMGVPSTDGHGMPAGGEVEEGAVVSGGGVVDKDEIEPEDAPEELTDLD